MKSKHVFNNEANNGRRRHSGHQNYTEGNFVLSVISMGQINRLRRLLNETGEVGVYFSKERQ